MNYSSKDFNSLYSTLKKTIVQKTNYDIDRDSSYKSSLNSIIQGVIRKNPKSSNQFINSLVLNTVASKFIDRINKSQNKTTCNNFPNLANRPINTDPRPQSSQFPPQKPVTPAPKTGLNNIFRNNIPEMKPDMFSRQVNQDSKNDIDISSLRESPEEKMNKMMKERGLLNNLETAEKKLANENKVSIADDNDFFIKITTENFKKELSKNKEMKIISEESKPFNSGIFKGVELKFTIKVETLNQTIYQSIFLLSNDKQSYTAQLTAHSDLASKTANTIIANANYKK